ncbi:MAG: class I SAM-dependent methyltransferase [Actinomycetota bacterium]|nr:class I SAM-dependent methyltransferase [Actinomycetota bacterium]
MSRSLLERLSAAHENATMVGWDFSSLDGRLRADEPPWDFEDMCRSAWAGAGSVLDLGTGGGERLLALLDRTQDQWLCRVDATEGWAPNVSVARQALAPVGVNLVEYDSESGQAMPFQAHSFDVVMARHESYDAVDVARVLRPAGRFLTQQVHGLDAQELRTWFGGQPGYPEVTLEHHVAAAVAAGLVIDGQGQWHGQMVFTDAEALVQYLGMVPWDVPDFSVGAHLEKLSELDTNRPIVVTQRRFWLTAHKPPRPNGQQ